VFVVRRYYSPAPHPALKMTGGQGCLHLSGEARRAGPALDSNATDNTGHPGAVVDVIIERDAVARAREHAGDATFAHRRHFRRNSG